MGYGTDNYQLLITKLDEFIRKYYKNQLIRGVLYTIATVVAFYLCITLLEYFGRFNTTVRTVMFYSFVLLALGVLSRYIIYPLAKLFHIGKVITHEQAAEIIGKHFSNVSDKLFNTLQLQKQNEGQNSALINASINQKIVELKPVPFSSAIDLNKNKKYLKYAIPPVLAVVVLLFAAPSLLRESTQRLLKHNTYFAEPAPFKFIVENKNLRTVQNEDFVLNVAVEGKDIPENIYININGNNFRLEKDNNVKFNYTFKNVQGSTDFVLQGNGYSSQEYLLEAIPNPSIMNFTLHLQYPAYLNRKPEVLQNTGDIIIPLGTKVTWKYETRNTEKLTMMFSDETIAAEQAGDEQFNYSRTFKTNNNYAVTSSNAQINNKDTMSYSINVVADGYPQITVDEQKDSMATKQVYFRGNINDDYGFSRLAFCYRYLKSGNDTVQHGEKVNYENLAIQRGISQEQFYHYVNLDNLKIQPGDELEYYFEVWDNDGVQGPKSARSQAHVFKAPSLTELEKEKEKSNADMKDEMSETMKQAKKIQKETSEILKKLTEKKKLEYDDKKTMEDLLKQQKDLQNKVENMKQQQEQNMKKQSEYKKEDERIMQKQEELQKLFDKVMSEDMKEKMREMEKLLNEMDKDKIKEKLEQMKMDNKDLEKELDRNLELFKQLEVEQKMNDAANKLEELAKKQEELSKKADDKNADAKELEKKQEELNKEFDEVKKDLQDAEKKNSELETPKDLPDTKAEQENVDKEQEKSSEDLQKGDKKSAKKSQKSAADDMQKMAQKIKKGMEEAEEEQAEEDEKALRMLLENLLRFSFDQEKLMADLKNIDVNNPKYLKLAQQQRKLKDDSRIIEDSLFALSKRVAQIQSIVNQEIGKINQNVEASIEHLEDRYVPQARSEQQYVMTSVNNLALILSESLQQMQQQMQQQKSGNGSCKKPGKGKPSPSAAKLRQMQQKLNDQMKQMKDGMKPGEKPGRKPGEKPGGQSGMSEQLAKMVAQQEAIRQALQEFNQENNKDGQGKLGDLEKAMKQMEDTQRDLLNRQISDETMKRQEDILTRLLESEKAERERDQEERRESNEPKQEIYRNPAQFEEFKKLKSRDTELIKTIPPTLNSFYKNLVNVYFQNIGK